MHTVLLLLTGDPKVVGAGTPSCMRKQTGSGSSVASWTHHECMHASQTTVRTFCRTQRTSRTDNARRPRTRSCNTGTVVERSRFKNRTHAQRVGTRAGHSGGSGTDDELDDDVTETRFACMAHGVKDGVPAPFSAGATIDPMAMDRWPRRVRLDRSLARQDDDDDMHGHRPSNGLETRVPCTYITGRPIPVCGTRWSRSTCMHIRYYSTLSRVSRTIHARSRPDTYCVRRPS